MIQSGPLRRSVLLGIAVLPLAGCWSSGSDDFRLSGDMPVPNGIIANRDVRIDAVDKSFELVGGEPFQTPFQTDLWETDFNGFTQNPAGFYPIALKHGAKRVVIYIGGDLTPLYGVLAFNPASQYSFGPGTQTYRIEISDADLTAAKNGDVAVSYEKVNWQHNDASNWWLGSVLWFSGAPLE
ncbi:MAG TPA: hypothetical protein VL993_17220 [Stellaceae bacterium]|nr:hypothetical protein [Stellaceae bacterium]